jgi:CBS domain-containing protein
VENGLLVGLLTKSALLKSMADSGGNDLAGNAMQRHFRTADPADRLETVLGPLQAGDCQTIPVVRNDLLLGIVTVASVRGYLAHQQAVRGDRK